MGILLKNAAIIPMDEPNRIIEKGCIGIQDDKIAFITEGSEIPADFRGERIIDASNKLVLPGFVNAHTHCAMTLLRGYSDDVPLQEWLFDRIFPIEDKLTPEDVYWGTLLSIMEMLRSGITAFADQYFFMDQVAEAVETAGVKANLSRGLQCFDDVFERQTDRRLREAEELYLSWNGKGNGRIKVWIGPHAVYTCVPRYLEESVQLAKDFATGIHIHLAENRREVDECRQRYGKTPVAHCASVGLFEVPVLAAHCVHVEENDMELLNRKDLTVVHNPGSNLKLGSGIAPVADFLERKINVALGTDGAASNNNLNILEEVSLAALLHKGITEDPTAVPAWEALKMSTANGAKGIGFYDTGILAPGKKADIAVFNLDKPHFRPLHNLVANLVYAGAGSDVETVIVDGKILMDGGRFLTIDEEMVKAKIKECCNRLFNG